MQVKLKIVHRKFTEPFAIRIVHSRAHAERARIAELLRKAGADNDPSDEFSGIKRWSSGIELDAPDVKKFSVVKNDDGSVADYRNVTLRGYLSTFAKVTPKDRQGDSVLPGAFTDTLKTFMDNPILLTDHRNAVSMVAGHFTSAREDRNGLLIEARLSDRPGNIDARFLVAEGILKTLSMGGLFYYDETGHGIFKVSLWEGSLTPLPANPDALFQVRSLNDTEKAFLKTKALWPSYYHFLESIGRVQNHPGVAQAA